MYYDLDEDYYEDTVDKVIDWLILIGLIVVPILYSIQVNLG